MIIIKKKTMNNYNNKTSFAEHTVKPESRYISCIEQKQTQWIESVAKQAVELISDQLRNRNLSK